MTVSLTLSLTLGLTRGAVSRDIDNKAIGLDKDKATATDKAIDSIMVLIQPRLKPNNNK